MFYAPFSRYYLRHWHSLHEFISFFHTSIYSFVLYLFSLWYIFFISDYSDVYMNSIWSPFQERSRVTSDKVDPIIVTFGIILTEWARLFWAAARDANREWERKKYMNKMSLSHSTRYIVLMLTRVATRHSISLVMVYWWIKHNTHMQSRAISSDRMVLRHFPDQNIFLPG